MNKPDGYEIRENGTILDLTGKVLKAHKERNGYLRVWIKQDGIRKKVAVHRLVACAFLPNPEDKPCVNHLDGNKENNHVSNLEWSSYSDNERHSHRVLGKKTSSENLKNMVEAHVKAVRKSVGQFSANGMLIRRFDSMADAAKTTGVSQGNISECCNGRRKSAGGYLWNFVI